MTTPYDPSLRARRDALESLAEELTPEEYDVAEKAIDKFLDCFDDIMGHSKNVSIHGETGHLLIITDDYESNS